jgi:hypothetical protein
MQGSTNSITALQWCTTPGVTGQLCAALNNNNTSSNNSTSVTNATDATTKQTKTSSATASACMLSETVLHAQLSGQTAVIQVSFSDNTRILALCDVVLWQFVQKQQRKDVSY